MARIRATVKAPDYESGGQEFESLRARQLFQHVTLATPF
jgi:hypothetical protein